MSYVYNHEMYVLLDKSWRWKYTGVPWLSCRNGMCDLVVVGLHVWRGEDGRDVETGELWQGKPAKMAERWPRFGGHGQAGSLHGPWTGWIGSAPVQTSGYGLDGALSWWCYELLLVVVVVRLSVVPRGREIGLLATKGIPLRIAADREKGRAAWRQVGLPAQSMPHRRFRGALRALICTFCMHVCIYVYVCMCADIYIYICVHVCMYMYMYAFINVCMCMCVHICA